MASLALRNKCRFLTPKPRKTLLPFSRLFSSSSSSNNDNDGNQQPQLSSYFRGNDQLREAVSYFNQQPRQSPTSSKSASDDAIRKNLLEFRRRKLSEALFPANHNPRKPISSPNQFNNGVGNPNPSLSKEGALTFDKIREELQDMQKPWKNRIEFLKTKPSTGRFGGSLEIKEGVSMDKEQSKAMVDTDDGVSIGALKKSLNDINLSKDRNAMNQRCDILCQASLKPSPPKEHFVEKNNAGGEWNPQAYQAVVDELNTKLGISVNLGNVKSRIKSWKKHHAVISYIRTFSKFKWDEEKKMIVIARENLEQWTKFVKDHPITARYRNKSIDYWDDICTLCGPDRGVENGVETHDGAAPVVDALESEGGSSTMGESSSSRSKKQERDRLADAVNIFAECFREYVQSNPEEVPKPTPSEVIEVVKKVKGIGRHEIMRAAKRFLDGHVHDLEMLKLLPEDEKLDWVLVCLNN